MQMQVKVRGWLTKAFVSKLNKCYLSFLLDKQFWPGVFFGITCICAPFATLEDCLMKTYYKMLPLCGICHSANKELRQLERGFCGAGLPNQGVECLVEQLEKLFTHYGSRSGIGIHMQALMDGDFHY